MQTSHIAIPTILKVGSGTLGQIGTYLKQSGAENAVLYFGNGLIKLFGDKVFRSLEEENINVLDSRELDTVDIDDIVKLAFEIDSKAQIIVGIGGGKVIDTAKYAAYLRKLPFISVPTSASSDGFSSASASLIVKGRRTSVPAKMAYGIVADTEVIKSAPARFIYSGIGDLVSKISSTYDWRYEETCGYTKVDDFAIMIAKKAVNSFVRTPFKTIQDDLFLRELLDSLAMSGIANEIAGGSSPTSGSEHLISHALDKLLPNPQLHGVQVGIGTYIMCRVQNHRYERVDRIFTDTGFWDYVASLELDRKDYEKAIDLAPTIKPYRHLYLHEERYRDMAKEILYNDNVLARIFDSVREIPRL